LQVIESRVHKKSFRRAPIAVFFEKNQTNRKKQKEDKEREPNSSNKPRYRLSACSKAHHPKTFQTEGG
jgi:hypothetical protein